jgi:glycogen debranching enzyme
VAPSGLIKRHALLMSKKHMSSLWSWDQCFNAMALAGGQDALAMDQMLVLVDHQDKFGSYPDAINDISIHYNFSKPPVHGWAFGSMLETMQKQPDPETLWIMYDSLSRQADWWMTYRRKEGSELPYYLHGNDSGWDNSTMFDQGVPLEAPDLASLLVVQMDVLAGLCLKVGRQEDQPKWQKRADRLFNALMQELWQGDHFAARLANDHSLVPNQSLIPWLAAILGERLPGDVRACLKQGIERHLTEWGLATELPESPKYESDGYWRGPVWGPSTYIAVCGMERCGYTDFAREIAKRFCALCDYSGFAENFDALTGAPLRDPSYTWTASVFLLMLKRL